MKAIYLWKKTADLWPIYGGIFFRSGAGEHQALSGFWFAFAS